MEREAATQALIESVKTRFPLKGFKLHPALNFCFSHTAGGMGVIAQEIIAKEDVLLVIPESLRCSISSVLTTKEHKAMIKKLLQKCTQWDNMFEGKDFALAVAVMHILSRKSKEPPGSVSQDPFVLQAATWPLEEAMKESSMFYWGVEDVKSIWNKNLLSSNFEKRRENVQQIFDGAVFPALKADADNFIDFSLEGNKTDGVGAAESNSKKKALENTFVYAFSLVWSRAHGSPDPELVPLVELFNGNSERVNMSEKPGKLEDKTIINVKMVRGKWPFLRGHMFRDDCNLPCSAVYANRDIEKGEELIIDYGDLSPVSFMFKYGTIPETFLNNHNIQAEVSLWCDPALISMEYPLRTQCLRKNHFPLEALIAHECTLCDLDAEDNSLQRYSQGLYEPPVIGSLRHFLILSVLAGDEELQRNIATGRIRGPLYAQQVIPLMCQVIDYNLEALAPGPNPPTSAMDIERAKKSDTPAWEKAALLARVVQRESLIMWRHAIAKQGMSYQVAGSTSETEGCNSCGRTYPCLKCGRCKKVQYCCREHQRSDWKKHKPQCGK